MAILRHHHEKEFVVVPNATLRDRKLCLKDIGLLVYMLSLPESWQFSISGLSKVINGSGKDAITASVARLEKAGYLDIVRLRDSSGRIKGVQWTVSDLPVFLGKDKTKNLSLINETPPGEKDVVYSKYILSGKWASVRDKRMKIDNYQCAICGTAKNLQVHHITYEHLGHEEMGDLITVCKTCHKKIHEHDINEKGEHDDHT